MIVTLAAGVSQNVSIAGHRFYFVDGDEKIKVTLKGSADARDFDLRPRQGVNSDVRFTGVEILNLSDEEQLIEFEISDREIFDNRIPEVTTIEPAGGSLPVEVLSSDIYVMYLNGRINPTGTGNGIMYSFVPTDAIWGSRVLMVSGVNVRLIGAYAETLEVSLGRLGQVNETGGFDFKTTSFRINGSEDSTGLNVGAECEWGDIAGLVGDLFPGGFSSVVTSTTLPVRNVQFDLTGKEFRLQTSDENLLGLAVAVTTMDGSQVSTGVDFPNIEIRIFGRLISE